MFPCFSLISTCIVLSTLGFLCLRFVLAFLILLYLCDFLFVFFVFSLSIFSLSCLAWGTPSRNSFAAFQPHSPTPTGQKFVLTPIPSSPDQKGQQADKKNQKPKHFFPTKKAQLVFAVFFHVFRKANLFSMRFCIVNSSAFARHNIVLMIWIRYRLAMVARIWNMKQIAQHAPPMSVQDFQDGTSLPWKLHYFSLQ